MVFGFFSLLAADNFSAFLLRRTEAIEPLFFLSLLILGQTSPFLRALLVIWVPNAPPSFLISVLLIISRSLLRNAIARFLTTGGCPRRFEINFSPFFFLFSAGALWRPWTMVGNRALGGSPDTPFTCFFFFLFLLFLFNAAHQQKSFFP